jgi:glycosidase
MPSMMDFPLHGRLRDALTEPEGRGYGVGLGKLYEAMMNDSLYPEPARMVLFEGNHDTNRIFSALGEDEALMRMAATVIATTRRTPQFFYGTELLLKSPIERDDGVVRSDFPGGWAGDAASGFSGTGLSPAQREFQSWLRKLLNWRKTASAVHGGTLVHYNPLNGVYVYFRADARQRVMVVLNKNATETRLELNRFAEQLPAGAQATNVISGQTTRLGASLNLPPRVALVLEIQPAP